jgi:hypothetical protein
MERVTDWKSASDRLEVDECRQEVDECRHRVDGERALVWTDDDQVFAWNV